jgi:hypothetical protein
VIAHNLILWTSGTDPSSEIHDRIELRRYGLNLSTIAAVGVAAILQIVEADSSPTPVTPG